MAAPTPSTSADTVRRRQYVDARYGQLHVTTTAPARPDAAVRRPVCCLPFSPRSGRDFDAFAALLGTDRRVHCPDVPGFGGSDAPPAPPAIADYAAALHEALDALESPARGPLDLFGQLVWSREVPSGEQGALANGWNQILWDGRNSRGGVVANGGYIARLRIAGTGRTYRYKVAVVK